MSQVPFIQAQPLREGTHIQTRTFVFSGYEFLRNSLEWYGNRITSVFMFHVSLFSSLYKQHLEEFWTGSYQYR